MATATKQVHWRLALQMPAYAAEDVIESYIVDNIHLTTAPPTQDDDEETETETVVEEISCIHFYQNLEKAIKAMELIKKEAMEMTKAKKAAVHRVDAGFRSSSPSERKSEMVGFDDVLLQHLDRLLPEPEFRPPMSEVVQALVRLVQRANMSKRTFGNDGATRAGSGDAEDYTP